MTWIKFEDKAPRHPKVAGLSHPAFRVWVTSMCYASEFLTDGVLPPVYLITVKAYIREELIAARLWDVDGEQTRIHDYLGHQSSRDAVSQKKADNVERVTRYREKKRNALQARDGNADVTQPDTENREQIQRTENREQRQNAPPLVMSPLAYEKRKQQCAFVGSRLEVPHSLHSDLRKQLGGANPDGVLDTWYLSLNDEIEESGEVIAPDVFRWLKARFAKWVVASARAVSDANQMARLEAIARGERKR